MITHRIQSSLLGYKAHPLDTKLTPGGQILPLGAKLKNWPKHPLVSGLERLSSLSEIVIKQRMPKFCERELKIVSRSVARPGNNQPQRSGLALQIPTQFFAGKVLKIAKTM
jgi:hypothetical protein